MVHARRGIEFVVRVAEAEFRKQGPGAFVLWVMTCENSLSPELHKCEVQDGQGDLHRIPLPPMLRAQVDADLVNALVQLVGTEPGTAKMVSAAQEKDRPVLDSERFR